MVKRIMEVILYSLTPKQPNFRFMSFSNKIVKLFKKTSTINLHLMGDSHIGDLKGIQCRSKKIDVQMCCVQGATASGLMNPHSKTLAGPVFYNFIDNNIGNKDWVVIHLGEVDCGFLIWVRAEREKISVSEQLEFTLNNYFLLLEKIMQKTSHVIVLSVIPPTIKDGTKFGNVANLRGQINANQKERALLTKQMNLRLKEFCNSKQIFFINLDENLIDNKTGLVHEHYLNENKDNHHLNGEKLRKVVSIHLEKVFINK